MGPSILLAVALAGSSSSSSASDGRDPIAPVTLRTPEGARAPHLAVGQDGRVYVAFGTKTAVYVSISPDAGARFDAPVKVADVESLALGLRRGPQVAIAGDLVVVTAIAGEHGGGRDGDLCAWRSSDKGKTWSSDGIQNDVPGSAREGLHAIAAGPEESLFCAWIDLASGAPVLVGASFTHAGSGAWTSPRVICGDSERICPCCRPSAAFDEDGKLYVMWRGVDGGARDMVVSTSSDDGQSFSAPAKLGTGSWRISACPMDGGAIDAARGQLRTIWRRETTVIRSGGTGSELQIGGGEQPWLATGSDGEYLVWLERRGGPLLLLRPGQRDPIRLDRVASDPVVAAEQNTRTRVLAAWESGDAAAPKIVVAILRDRAQARAREK